MSTFQLSPVDSDQDYQACFEVMRELRPHLDNAAAFAAQARRLGVGGKLLDALRDEARRQDCVHFVLDTALGNALGQRFYFRQGLLARGMHFCQPL